MLNKKGFTLVELLIVIGILSVLAIAVVLIINPAEYLARSRDSVRVNDLENIDKYLGVYETQGGSFSSAESNTVYVSIPDDGTDSASDANTIADDCDEHSLPSLSEGWRYKCVSSASGNLRKTDGTGWIPLDLSSVSAINPPTLPIDPINTASDSLYFTFIKGSWNLIAGLESEKYYKDESDHGTDPVRHEAGTDLGLWSKETGLVGYWAFDEERGSSAADRSGRENNGSFEGSPVWQAVSNCKRGACLRFDSSGDRVKIPDHSTLDIPDKLTVLMWFHPLTLSPSGGSVHPITKYVTTTDNNFQFYYCGTACGSDNTMIWYANRGGTWGPISARSVSLTTNNWHFIGMTYDNGGQLYWDGSPRGTKTGSGALDTTSADLRIGLNGTGNDYIIDEVRIYNRALSGSEISKIYKAVK